eukprot:gene2065-12060_t
MPADPLSRPTEGSQSIPFQSDFADMSSYISEYSTTSYQWYIDQFC